MTEYAIRGLVIAEGYTGNDVDNAMNQLKNQNIQIDQQVIVKRINYFLINDLKKYGYTEQQIDQTIQNSQLKDLEVLLQNLKYQNNKINIDAVINQQQKTIEVHQKNNYLEAKYNNYEVSLHKLLQEDPKTPQEKEQHFTRFMEFFNNFVKSSCQGSAIIHKKLQKAISVMNTKNFRQKSVQEIFDELTKSQEKGDDPINQILSIMCKNAQKNEKKKDPYFVKIFNESIQLTSQKLKMKPDLRLPQETFQIGSHIVQSGLLIEEDLKCLKKTSIIFFQKN